MYNNFKEYWEAKKGVFEKLGVSRDVAHMIWSDAVDALAIRIMEKEIRIMEKEISKL